MAALPFLSYSKCCCAAIRLILTLSQNLGTQNLLSHTGVVTGWYLSKVSWVCTEYPPYYLIIVQVVDLSIVMLS